MANSTLHITNLISTGFQRQSTAIITDVAEMRGVGQPSMQSIGWGASFVDFDSDGWPDLTVANGSTFEEKDKSPRSLAPMPSFLFWNGHGEYFHDLAPWNLSLSKPHVSRGLAVADFDNDGAMDIAIVDPHPPRERPLDSRHERRRRRVVERRRTGERRRQGARRHRDRALVRHQQLTLEDAERPKARHRQDEDQQNHRQQSAVEPRAHGDHSGSRKR